MYVTYIYNIHYHVIVCIRRLTLRTLCVHKMGVTFKSRKDNNANKM